MQLVATLALVTAYAFADGDAARTNTTPPAPEPSAALGTSFQDELNRRVAAIDRSGIIVGFIDGDTLTVFKAGTSGTARPLDDETLFEIGSVTKTVTATLLATMVLDGTVKLEDPVAKYMPAGVTIPSRNGKEITLLELATQHSGLPRLPNNMNTEDSNDPYAQYFAADMYDFVSRYSLPRDPGETFEYSNIGVALLGQALANRAGVPYATLLKRRVLDPLGMHDTAIELSPTQLPRFAAGANADGDPSPPWTMTAIAPAGGLRSTLRDMLEYLRCNMGRGPIAQACLFAQQPRSSFPGNAIGLIWWTGDAHHIIHHGGDTAGFHASVAISPDRKRGVVVLANGGMPVEDIALHALDSSISIATIPPSLSLDRSALDAYTGTYVSKDDASRFVITRSGDHLLARLGNQPAARIYASAPDHFYYRIVDARLQFFKDRAGEASAVVLRQAGQAVVYVAPGKTAPPEDALFPPIVTLDRATLQQYVGNYGSAYGTFYVTLAGGQLSVRLETQQALPTYPSAKDRFYYKVVDARIEFERDAAGNVTGLILHQGGADVAAKRK